jgi:hypothetical protein
MNQEIIRRPPPPYGMGRLELIHQDAKGKIIGYQCGEGKGILHQPGVGRRVDTLPLLPPIGPFGLLGALITIPTVGHNGFAADIQALTGWEFAIGIGTAAEASGDSALASEITTYGGARASVTPTILNNVVTWTHQWTFTTGASFAVIEAGLFRNSVLRLRHLYSVAENMIPTHKLTATFTDTL